LIGLVDMKSSLVTESKNLKWGMPELLVQIYDDLSIRFELFIGKGNPVCLNKADISGSPVAAIQSAGKETRHWKADLQAAEVDPIRGPFGPGERLRLRARDDESLDTGITITLDLEHYDNRSSVIFLSAIFESDAPLSVDKIIMNRQLLDASSTGGTSPDDAWIYNGSGETREHHLQALYDGYEKQNYFGLLESHDGGGYQPDYRDGSQPGYGGGIPLIDIWTKGMGLGIGHVDTSFRYINLPVKALKSDGIRVAMEWNPRGEILPGRPLRTFRGFVSLHTGDFYNSLEFYRTVMEQQGMIFSKSVAGSYEPQWDTWGFNADFTMDDVRETLPYLKEIGIRWLTLDDRWFDVAGDWMPRRDTFPEGEKSLIEFIEELHREGFKVRLWTIPGEFDGKPDLEEWQAQHPNAAIEIAKHPFHAESQLYKDHPEWMVSAPDGTLEYSKRGNYFAQGKLPQVQSYFRELTRKMFLEWKIDGLKQDAVYMSPPDYNPDHGLSSPDEAGDGYVAMMRVVYETALECNPDAVILNCPCGTPVTAQWMPWQNQAITVDPWTSWVNRGVFKEMKGLFGPSSPVVLDHIEISDEGEDFSVIGIGGIPATRFTPSGRDRTNEIEDRIFEVRPFQEKLDLWKHWFGLYNRMRLSEGEYMNLYDIIYDIPETHVVRKAEKFYYSLYPGEPDGIVDDGGAGYREKKHTKHWAGRFRFRGLNEKIMYQVRDWEHDTVLGLISGNYPVMDFDIDHHLLLELSPVSDDTGIADISEQP